MLDLWSFVRFLHVLGAALWVGGQLIVSLVVLPLARRELSNPAHTAVLTAIGRRFGLLTAGVFLPVQIATGALLAWRAGVTWSSLARPSYSYDWILFAKLLVFVGVMAAAGLHSWARLAGRNRLARIMAVSSVAGSVVIIVLATALVGG